MAKNTIRMLAAVLIGLVSAGCTSDSLHALMRAKASEVTDFLPENERLVRQPDTYPVHYSWMDTNAVKRAAFSRIYVAPIDLTYLRKGIGYDEWRNRMTGIDEAINDLGEYGRDAFIRAFQAREAETGLTVTDDPTEPDTAILELAITGFVPTRAEIEVIGTVGSVFVPFPGVGLVADVLAAGQIALECRVRDSATGEVVIMFANTESEPKALLHFAKFTYTASAKINLKRMANALVESCAVEDATQRRRDFPFSFMTVPWESRINE